MMKDNYPQDIDPERQRQAAAYARGRYLLMGAELATLSAYVLAWLLTGLSRGVSQAVAALTPFRPAQVALYLALLAAGYGLITLPLTFLAYRLSRRHGLSVQGVRAWLADLVKMDLLGLTFGLVVGEVLYALLAADPGNWWLWTGAVLFAFSAILANLFPVLIVPLFYKMTPLDDPELAGRLTRLAQRAATRVRGVFTINFSAKTTAANAALMGWGNTRRIVLGDTLLATDTPDEIEVVLAHELGHHVHGDLWKGWLVSGLLQWGGLWVAAGFLAWAVARWGFAGVGDLAAFPLLAVALGGFGLVSMPLENAYSRWRERLADAYALHATGNAPAFLGAMTKLANQNLSQVEPPRWAVWLLFSHPPMGELLRMGERAMAGHRQ